MTMHANDEHAAVVLEAMNAARAASNRAAFGELADCILTMIRAARAAGASMPEAIAVSAAFVQGAFAMYRDDGDGNT